MEAHQDRIIVKTAKGFRQVEVAHISHILCEDYICTLYLINKSKPITCTKSLHYFEQVLPHYPFVRIHHQAIVNLMQVTEVSCKGRQRHVVMTDGTILPISVRKWPAFREAFRNPIPDAPSNTVTDNNITVEKYTDTPVPQ